MRVDSIAQTRDEWGHHLECGGLPPLSCQSHANRVIAHLGFHHKISIPETTSAEAFCRYAGGKCLFESRGEAWRDIKAWLTALPPTVDMLHVPSVSELFLAWTTSGEVDFQERENNQPWITHRIRKGSFFLTSGGAPYDIRWKAVNSEPFETMLVFVELPLHQRALERDGFREGTVEDKQKADYGQ